MQAARLTATQPERLRRIGGCSPAKAIGAYFKRTTGTRWHVVGIVEDGKYWALTERRKPAVFFSVLQSPTLDTWMVVRSPRDPVQLAAAIRSALRGVDAGVPLEIQTRYATLDNKLLGPRMATASLGVLGAIGTVLAVTGIFGMAAYSVSKRKRELGIRIALGAQRKEVLQAALGPALKLLALGSAAGLVLGILASRVLASIVYLATPRDPFVLTGVVVAMALVGLLASWIPAQRALSVNPLILMREE